jgi:hypothetical protein
MMMVHAALLVASFIAIAPLVAMIIAAIIAIIRAIASVIAMIGYVVARRVIIAVAPRRGIIAAAPAAAIVMMLGKGRAGNGEGKHRRRDGQKSAHVSLSFSVSSNPPSSLNAF